MLTKEKITATPGLESLTTEQLSALELLSKNDEDGVMRTFTKNFHDELDKTIRASSGMEKVGDEKSYEYAARIIKGMRDAGKDAVSKSDYDKLKGEYDTLQATAGDPEGWKRKYEDEQRTTSKLRKDMQVAKLEHTVTMQKAQVRYAIDSAVADLAFDAAVPESLRNLAKDSAIAKITGYKAEIDAEKGNITFRDANDEVLTNPKNYQNPYTVKELLIAELEPYSVLAKGKPQTSGTGLQPPAGNQDTPATAVTIGIATTKQDAMAAVQASLAQQGLVRGSREWAVAEQKAYMENKISDLPEAAE